MINEVLLCSDNPILLSEVHQILHGLSIIPNLNYSILDSVGNNTLKANQTLIFLSSDENKIIDIQKNMPHESSAYITSSPNPKIRAILSNIEVLGSQRHLSDNEDPASNYNLGAIRNNISITEPAIRESDLFLLDLDVLRSAEIYPASFSNPSGLFTEDISQMCRYAGMTEMNRYFLINHATPECSSLIAQLIWYFAEAASLRFPDHPYFTNTVEEYAVHVSSFDTMLTFYKSKSSGRWWVKIPNIQDNKWKSCGYEDYQLACKDNISPELLEIITVPE